MNAARHASAKSMVNAETVFSLTPQIGLFSSGAITGAGGAASARFLRLPTPVLFLARVTLPSIPESSSNKAPAT
jgi:hypothetical protein